MAVLKDVADELGVSISTVSRALRDDRRISEDMKRQVFGAAESLGYKYRKPRKSGARNFRSAGIIVPEVLSEYYARLMHIANGAFAARDYSTVLRITNFDPAAMVRCIRELGSFGVDCLMIVVDESEELGVNVLEAVRTIEQPVFFITMNYMTKFDYDCLFIDERRGIGMALEHLKERGYRRIGFIGERQTLGRCRVYEEIMSSLDMQVDRNHIKIVTPRFEEGGYEAMRRLLEEPIQPDAVFVSYDQMAVGAVHAIEEAGFRIPGDIALVSFDGIALSKYISRGLTTIQSPFEDMIAIAVRVLLNRLDGIATTPQQIALKPSLVVRETT